MEARKIIITGGATRIGAAIAERLSGNDKEILIHFNKSKLKAEKLKKELELKPPTDAASRPAKAPAPSKEHAKPIHNMFTHFPMDPKCPICNLNKITRVQCRRKKASDFTEADDAPFPTKFLDQLTADHTFTDHDLSLIHI